MKEKRLSIVINKPVSEVFLFTITPTNTPLWIDRIVEEKTSEWPVKVGTVYKNRGENTAWSVYVMSLFEEDKKFRLTAEDKNYSVLYTFQATPEGMTKLDYYELVERGTLEAPFEQTVLEKLKKVIEAD